MTDVFHPTKPAANEAFMDATASTAIAPGTLVYRDPSTKRLKPASAQPDQLTEVGNQGLFARHFAGVSNGRRLATQTSVGELPVIIDGQIELPCSSASFEVGDYVGAVEAASGVALADAQVKKVSSLNLAIGVVTRRYAAATTRVWARLLCRIGAADAAHQFHGFFQQQGAAANVETLAANKALSVADAAVQSLDPGGAGRNVTLPAESISAGLTYFIHNTADAAEVLTVKASNGSDTVCTPGQNETAIVYCDGVAWRGLVAANN